MREYMGNNDPKYSRTAKKHEQHHSSKNHNGPRKRPVRRPKKKMSLFSKILLGLALTALVCIPFRGNVVLHVGKRFTNVVRTAPRQCRLNHDL